MIQRLKRLDPISVGVTLCLMYAVIGFIAGVIFAVIALPSMLSGRSTLPTFGGASAIIVFPLLYGAVGFVGGVILTAFYNIVARVTGGIEMHLE